VLHEQFHDAADADLLFVVEAPEPSGEFVRALNLPRHVAIMPLKE
jgi:hypothetical protein